jgi:hypothetical protein
MALNADVADIVNYQLFAYQETSAAPVPSLWKKVRLLPCYILDAFLNLVVV